MKRPYGSGQIYEKWGAYYARWRAPDGRRLNRRLGPKRKPGCSDGLTRPQAEQAFRRVQSEEASRKPVEIITVDQAADRLRERMAIEGARLSYRQNCESMQRVHISPALGKRDCGVDKRHIRSGTARDSQVWSDASPWFARARTLALVGRAPAIAGAGRRMSARRDLRGLSRGSRCSMRPEAPRS